MITIPREIVEFEQLDENQIVEIKIKKKRKDYFGALKGIGEFTEKDKMEDRR